MAAVLEITEADRQKARQRRFDYLSRTGHYEDPEKLLDEIEALRRMLAAEGVTLGS